MLEDIIENIKSFCKIHNIALTEDNNCPQCLSGESGFSKTASPEDEITPENDSPDAQPAIPDEPEKEDKQSGDSQPAETLQPEDADQKAADAKNSMGFENSKTKNFVAVQGRVENIFLKYDSYNSTIALFKESKPLSLEDAGELDESLAQLITSLEKERLLVLGDTGDERGFTVSRQIAKTIKIDNKKENVRMFYLDDRESKDPSDINSFDFKRERSSGGIDIPEALVVIDATKAKRGFSDSLLNSGVSFAKHHLLPILQQNYLYLMCVVESEHINDWKEHLDKRNFPYQNFDSPKEKDNEKESDVSQQAENLLRLESEVDGTITKTILFVASFFPNLATPDFNDLIRRWLMNEPDITRPEATQNNAEDSVLTKISLGQIWDLKSHIFTGQCFLSQKKDGQGKKIITFNDEAYLKYFRDRIESKYFIFLDKKISDILDFGLIFHSSPEVSNRSIRILVEFIHEIEDKLDEWLLDVFRFLETKNLNELGRHLKVGENSKKHFYYDRLAELFRALLSDSSLTANVNNVLDRLIHNKFHESVLKLVKSLYNAPNFDRLRWLKELLDRGDSPTRQNTLGYLFVNLIKISTAAVFESLKIWLPDEETAVKNYSPANKAALALLIDYYSYQTYVFDEQYYGLEPCQFPLFVFDDRASAEGQLALIVKYLLHPANFILLSDELPYIYHVAYLLERWTAILYRDSNPFESIHDNPKLPEYESAAEAARFTNKEILDHLLEQFILNSDKYRQEELISIWERFMGELGALINDLEVNWKARENASKRRKIVRNLIENFKKIRRTKRLSAV